MDKQSIIGIVKKILTFYEYDIKSSEISDMLAEKDSDHLFIRLETTTNLHSIRHFSNSVQIYGGKGIIILDSVDKKTRSIAEGEGLSIWDRNELESWVGRAVLSGALEETTKVQAAKEAPILPEIHKPAPSQLKSVQVQKEDVKKVFERTIRILLRSAPVSIGKEDAISIAEAKVGKSKSHKLNFIPVWHYIYSFNTQKKFKSRFIDLAANGEGHINALTGLNFFGKYENIQENTFVPTQNYEIKHQIISKSDALNKAMDAIIREHTKEIRLNEMIGDTIVFEHKVFAPVPEDIDMKMELLHIPIWEIRGSGETIEINAYDGHIVGIKAYSDAVFV
ncbi:MAG: hypothetical protein J5U19_09395 [Candidatus Methanoperedens sp.]|nr:hypothetical protein [Candidatus Methanoperedens sp.]